LKLNISSFQADKSLLNPSARDKNFGQRRDVMSKSEMIRQLVLEGCGNKEIAERLQVKVGLVYIIVEDLQQGGGIISRKRVLQGQWRKKNKARRNKERYENYLRGNKNAFNRWQPWLTRDDVLVTDWLDGTDRQLAVLIGRSVRAIQARRTKLKKLSRKEKASAKAVLSLKLF